MLPSTFGAQIAMRVVATLARGHRTVDGLRRLGKSVAAVATDVFAFGDDVPASYVEFVDEMLSATPFEVVAEFFPNFGDLDKFHTIHALAEVPDHDHLRHRRTSSPRSATAASCTTGSTARRCWSARAPGTW